MARGWCCGTAPVQPSWTRCSVVYWTVPVQQEIVGHAHPSRVGTDQASPTATGLDNTTPSCRTQQRRATALSIERAVVGVDEYHVSGDVGTVGAQHSLSSSRRVCADGVPSGRTLLPVWAGEDCCRCSTDASNPSNRTFEFRSGGNWVRPRAPAQSLHLDLLSRLSAPYRGANDCGCVFRDESA